jgi:UDP-sulfoquinovose synthase
LRIVVLGGDGFCGWPTTLRLLESGHEVLIIDNLSRRNIDSELGTNSLTPISSIEERLRCANSIYDARLSFLNIDVANDYEALVSALREFSPKSVVQFAEQRSAPYSMISSSQRRYTVDNNVSGTHNICSAIVETDREIHLVHLGTMGVYGYSKQFGEIPEGYLDVTVNSTQEDVSILYPANPGSIYHMTKCLDQLLFQFYNKNWGLRITDLHQGIVWGIETKETKQDKRLINRFDYDGVYGTVLNRFIAQAANDVPLTVYGSGRQTRAFIHINDSAECVRLSIENSDFNKSKVRIFNQVAETRKLNELADILSESYGASVRYLENPRKELAENELEVSNAGLRSLGFEPILLTEALIEDVRVVAEVAKHSFNEEVVLNSPKW